MYLEFRTVYSVFCDDCGEVRDAIHLSYACARCGEVIQHDAKDQEGKLVPCTVLCSCGCFEIVGMNLVEAQKLCSKRNIKAIFVRTCQICNKKLPMKPEKPKKKTAQK